MISFMVFVFGLAIGSFLNALVYRLEKGESASHGRSYCDYCKHQLTWYDLIPLLSYILLRGRCRYCQQKISLQYPLVELATGLLFLALFMFTGTLAELRFLYVSYLWAMAAFLIVIFVYDLKHYLIPDKILYPAIGLALLWRVFEFLDQSTNFVSARPSTQCVECSGFEFWISALLVQSLLAGISASVFFFAIFLVSRGGAMGFGDVKLAFLLGLFLGWPLILVALFSAFCLGAIIGLCLIALKKKGLKSEVPFAPFLIVGSAIALFFGSSIIDWYLGLFLV